MESDPPIGEVLGAIVALLVLTVTFGSLLAAGLPLLTALLGVGVGMLGIELASGFTHLTSTSTTLAAMLGLAVGIDYSLFILSRHRAQVREGMGISESIALAVGTAGSAVVFAGSTVIIALAALSVTGVPFLAQMGIAAAGSIAVAVLLSLTLVPALLAFGGQRLLRGKTHAHGTTMGARWVGDRHAPAGDRRGCGRDRAGCAGDSRAGRPARAPERRHREPGHDAAPGV